MNRIRSLFSRVEYDFDVEQSYKDCTTVEIGLCHWAASAFRIDSWWLEISQEIDRTKSVAIRISRVEGFKRWC